MKNDEEFNRNWSCAGSRHDTLREVAAFVRAEAGKAFAAGNDAEANSARNLAVKIDQMAAIAEARLNEFIAENEKRRSYS